VKRVGNFSPCSLPHSRESLCSDMRHSPSQAHHLSFCNHEGMFLCAADRCRRTFPCAADRSKRCRLSSSYRREALCVSSSTFAAPGFPFAARLPLRSNLLSIDWKQQEMFF
jgi:hypothetical protein